MEWTYHNEPFTAPGSDFIGFVYIIANTMSGRRYIGKKNFFFTKTKKIKGRNKRIKSESDWKTYWSSSEELKADVALLGPQNFTREIIHLCKSKGTMNYLEAKEQFMNSVLESPEWYNSYIQVRCHRSHVKL